MNIAMRKGWCPSLFEPMQAGDGYLVRVKPRTTGFSSAQLQVVADAARRYGSGRIEITNRANLQIRGLSAGTVQDFGTAMVAAGLANADPAVERRRNIQLPVDCDAMMLKLAAGLEQWIETDKRLELLPAKFGFSVSEAGLDDAVPAADIRIVLGPQACAVAVAGTAAVVEPGQILETACALTYAFLELADQVAPRPARMKALVAALGATAIFEKAGLATGPDWMGDAPPQKPAALPPELFRLGLPFGAADAGMIAKAADLAEKFGSGTIRLSGARSLVLMGVTAPTRLAEAAEQAGFVVDPDDPRLRIAACAGYPACGNALIDTRAVAGLLAAHWQRADMLHVSGCAKGCANPGPAALTLTGITKDRFDVVVRGRAGDPPDHAAISFGKIVKLISESDIDSK